MTTIYLTRHGETEWNIQRRMQGRMDSPLTELGKQQATNLGRRLTDVPLNAIYSSTAPRAKATAALIRGERSIPLHVHEGLCEMGLGVWEGKAVSDLFETENERCQNFFYHPELFIPPEGAESFGEVQQRLAATLNELAAKHKGETLLLVAHGVVMRNLLAYLQQKPLQEVWDTLYKPTALSLVTAHNAQFEIKFWNDTSHYEEKM